VASLNINGIRVEYAQTVAMNILAMFEIFYLFNSRYTSLVLRHYSDAAWAVDCLFKPANQEDMLWR
jgi:hypothetical protein